MRLMPSCTARRSTRTHSSRSSGSPQIPGPVSRIAPKPRRRTSSWPPRRKEVGTVEVSIPDGLPNGLGDQPLNFVRRAADQLRHLVLRLAELREHVAGNDVGVGGVGTVDTHADALEVRAPEALLEGLEAVVAGQSAS